MTVGIVITCHDEAPWIENAIASAFAQTHPASRIVVVNDGSTDDSMARICNEALKGGFQPTRFTGLTISNRGMAAARNAGLMAIDTDWVVHLDGDDWLEPTFVAETMAVIQAEPCDAVVTNLNRDDGYMHVPGPTNLAEVVERCELHSCALFSREALVSIGGFRSDLGGDCDWGAWVELLARGARVAYAPTTAYHYRRRAGSLTSTEGPEDRRRHHALIRELAGRNA